jgi:PAS domain S-box-containing protein
VVLLDRLSTPMLGAGLDAVVVYANPACAAMFGYESPASLKGKPLSELLTGQSRTPPQHCVALLRAAHGSLKEWRHATGYPISTVVSGSVVRATDPLLLVTISDITEWLWAGFSGSNGSPQHRWEKAPA